MHASFIHKLLILIILETVSARTLSEHVKRSTTFMQDEEDKIALGGTLELTDEEEAVNKILMTLKDRELDSYFPHNFNFSKHYFTYNKRIKDSEVYQMIRKMPKGAVLHTHGSFLLGADYFVKLTYDFHDNLYACNVKDDLKLTFSIGKPNMTCDTEWALLSELRKSSDNVDRFDEQLRKHFTMNSEDYTYHEYNSDSAWKKFDAVYRAMKSLLKYRPVREQYFRDTLKAFYDDNIMYLEIRSGLSSLYELNGTVHDGKYIARLQERIVNEFKQAHPEFIGVKFIIADHRKVDEDVLRRKIEWALEAKEELPNMIIGYDLVGQEDLGHPLSQFRSTLFDAKDKIDFYFHAGETNWNGMSPDLNLMDAIALGTKRIGHGLSLVKHPILMTLIQKKDIAIEVNVVSNVVLGYVRDLRNHPLATYLALGLPVVISSDDPGAWESDPLSHDFFLAFMAVANRKADLKLLKKLALNSIKYSGLDSQGKEHLQTSFDKRWKRFLKEINNPT